MWTCFPLPNFNLDLKICRSTYFPRKFCCKIFRILQGTPSVNDTQSFSLKIKTDELRKIAWFENRRQILTALSGCHGERDQTTCCKEKINNINCCSGISVFQTEIWYHPLYEAGLVTWQQDDYLNPKGQESYRKCVKAMFVVTECSKLLSFTLQTLKKIRKPQPLKLVLETQKYRSKEQINFSKTASKKYTILFSKVSPKH